MITIIDYGMGNLGSIANMLKKVGAQAQITADPAAIAVAEKLILPGVGAFDNGMKALEARSLLPILNQRVLEDRVPILGLCLGAQLFTRGSEEGNCPGLGWIDARTVRFNFGSDAGGLKVPHMGWNRVRLEQPNPLFEGMTDEWRFYFVHSYHIVADDAREVLLTTRYGHDLVSGVVRDNIVGVQFHPEKSHKFGMRLFHNFVTSA